MKNSEWHIEKAWEEVRWMCRNESFPKVWSSLPRRKQIHVRIFFQRKRNMYETVLRGWSLALKNHPRRFKLGVLPLGISLTGKLSLLSKNQSFSLKRLSKTGFYRQILQNKITEKHYYYYYYFSSSTLHLTDSDYLHDR